MKCVFITGAGAGIGQETARLFAKQGWFVGLYDRDEAAVKRLAEEIGSAQAMYGKLDVTDIDQWKESLGTFFNKTSKLDLLINNAGILFSGAFENITAQQHQQIINVNVQGVINGCHSAFPYLQTTPNSRVINLSSASAIYGQPDLATYSASKFAVRGLTEALDNEWKIQGIRVLDIMPLFVKTAMVKDMNAASFRKMGAKLTPNDVAQTIFHVAKESSPATHTPVGLTTRILYTISGFAPDRLNHWLNGLISK